MKFVKSHRNLDRRGNGERRSVISQAPLYCFNVNRTSLDHLLLGGNADGDRMSRNPRITRDRGDSQNKQVLNSCVARENQVPIIAFTRTYPILPTFTSACFL